MAVLASGTDMEPLRVSNVPDSAPEGRRRAMLRVDADAFVRLFRESEYAVRLIDNGLPRDAVVVGARYDAVMDYWDVAVESASFPLVHWSEMLPVLPSPVFRIEP